ncbi:MAG: hypothetical protein NVSMB59_23170 [Vulcanimicrobiaceae bacterium]
MSDFETPVIRVGGMLCVGLNCSRKRIDSLQLEGVVVNICPTEVHEACPYAQCPVILACQPQRPRA